LLGSGLALWFFGWGFVLLGIVFHKDDLKTAIKT
jgi:hypothetical protein